MIGTQIAGNKGMIEVTATTNPYIARWEKRMERPEDWGGMDGLLFAARSHYGSLTLGREFGQSMADFELSGPRIDQAREDPMRLDERSKTMALYSVPNITGPFPVSDFPAWARQLIEQASFAEWVKLTGTIQAKMGEDGVYMICDCGRCFTIGCYCIATTLGIGESEVTWRNSLTASTSWRLSGASSQSIRGPHAASQA